jgi:alanyl-tRNA synthetase
MTSNEIRASFLDYFARNGHRIVASSPLVPAGDPTLLFTNAGMNQFKDTFLGREQRDYRRATSSQKCMRISGKHNDLENVGPSPRHHTFFEMLGNFSFGDYFKKEAIHFAWELLTDVWKLQPDRLHATVFSHWDKVPLVPRDDDAYEIWKRYLPAGQISELGSDNFWQMGDTGPCGRCSEVHYFRGNDLPCDQPVCLGVACECQRYVEVWNNVFMEFDRQADGTLDPLPAPSIDTGMGLERITAILQGVISNYDTDLFAPLLSAIGDIAGTKYEAGMSPTDVSMRVIADHARATTFCIADGVVPSTKGRGYELRRIMRRAMRHGKRLGIGEPFFHRLVDVLVREMGEAYPELGSHRDYAVRLIRTEEQRFESVLTNGLPRLEEALDRAAAGDNVLGGEDALRLYETYGVPRDFIEDQAAQRGVGFDTPGFEKAMEAQKAKARAGSTFGLAASGGAAFEAATEGLRGSADRFEGYTATRVDGAIVMATLDEDGQRIDGLAEGQAGYVALDRTPFYVESGGQVSDIGTLASDAGTLALVQGLVKAGPDRPRLHRVRVTAGELQLRDTVVAAVDEQARDATRRNHTATHLLHAALRQVLGSHVKQGGSLVSPDRLRFDFAHDSALTAEQLEQVESIVNEQIRKNTPVRTELKSTDEAVAAGAMALFGEKYGDTVRVVSVPGFSMELCGGTHVTATGDIGLFTIVQEGGVAAGVRRIEALTGAGALALHQAQRRSLDSVLAALKTPADQAVGAIERLQSEVKRLTRENVQIKLQSAVAAISAPPIGVELGTPAADDTVNAGGVKMVGRRVQGLDKAALGQLADTLKNTLHSGVVVLASENDGRVTIVVSVTKDLVPRVHAGNIVKKIAPLVGGGGGGRPDFAEAGGKNAAGIDQMLAEARTVVSEMAKE